MKGTMFFFSGTGNTEYAAKYMARRLTRYHGLAFSAVSVEENVDFDRLIRESDTIGICYPIYGSYIPSIMRKFVLTHKEAMTGKSIVVLCTQGMFSGDGARCTADLLAGTDVTFILAEHIRMPNNICNFRIFPLESQGKIRKIAANARKKMNGACLDLARGRGRLRGFHPGSHLLGLIQRPAFRRMEPGSADKVWIHDDACIRCGLCVRECPAGNLVMEKGRVDPLGKCMLCYRCINHCPQMAISIWSEKRTVKQYKGILGE